MTTEAITVKPDTNAHIHEYLSYYLALRHPPHYAVLLNGPWGVGKTFLMKKYLADHFPGYF